MKYSGSSFFKGANIMVEVFESLAVAGITWYSVFVIISLVAAFAAEYGVEL